MTFLFLLFLSVRAFGAGDLNDHPARQEAFWGSPQKQALEEKVRSAPPELIDYLRKDNENQGWANKPSAATLAPDFVADVRAAIRELPEALREKISRKTIGIFFVEDLGGSAFSSFIYAKDHPPSSGFVVIDRSVVNRNANEWATWKESTPFRWGPGTSLRARIEEVRDDRRKNALQYILLHEFGHVLSIGSPLVPLWGQYWEKTRIDAGMAFFHASWKIKEGKLSSLEDESWPEREKIAYYASESKKLDGALALGVYRKLATTNFANLYAATNPFDDFAEAFANYVHVVVLKKPWTVTVASPQGKQVFEACWAAARCVQKRALLAKLME